ISPSCYGKARPEEELMHRGTIVIVFLSLLGAVQLTTIAEAATSRPIVYGKTQWEWPGEGRPLLEWGGIFASWREQRQQLTDHAGDKEPNVSPDGTEIAFVRDGDVYVMNADGSGQRQLSSGPDLDERPQFAP